MSEEKLNRILLNQRAIMIWISKGKYYEGFFKIDIEETEKIINKEKE